MNKFPKGWDEERVHRVLAHYEKQTEEEALAEDEAAYEDRTQTTIDIPIGTTKFLWNVSDGYIR